jgi:hypothetical protein
LNRRLGTPGLLWTLWKRENSSPPPPAVKELNHFLTSYGLDYHLYSCLAYNVWYVRGVFNNLSTWVRKKQLITKNIFYFSM